MDNGLAIPDSLRQKVHLRLTQQCMYIAARIILTLLIPHIAQVSPFFDIATGDFIHQARLLHAAIKEWHTSAEGRLQAATFKLPSWEYMSLLLRLGGLPHGLHLMIDLVLWDLRRRHEAKNLRTLALLCKTDVTFASDVVNRYEWDQWTYLMIKRWCERVVQHDRDEGSLPRTAEATLLQVSQQVRAQQHPAIGRAFKDALPQTSWYLYTRLRRLLVQDMLHSILRDHLPTELICMVSDNYLSRCSIKERVFRPQLENRDRCWERKCCCGHSHVYGQYLMRWDQAHGNYRQVHAKEFEEGFDCDMAGWTCVGASRTVNDSVYG